MSFFPTETRRDMDGNRPLWNDSDKTAKDGTSWITSVCNIYHPFLSQEWLISNFPCSLTRIFTSHSMKNLAFHGLLRWKMIILPILTISLIHFYLKGWENATFYLGSERVKGGATWTCTCVHMRKFSPVNRDEKARGASNINWRCASWTYFHPASGHSFADSHTIMTAAKWYTFEMENSADKARYCMSPRPLNDRHAQLKHFHPGQPGWSVHMSPVNRDPGRRDRDLGWPSWPACHMNISESFITQIVGGRDFGQPGQAGQPGSCEQGLI